MGINLLYCFFIKTMTSRNTSDAKAIIQHRYLYDAPKVLH